MLSKRRMLNKDHTKWILPSGQQTSGQSTTVVKSVKGGGQNGKKVVVNRPPTKERTKERTKETPAQSAEVPVLIDLFKEVNPSYRLYLNRNPQRAAADRLLKIHPIDWWKQFMPAYRIALEDRYCPRATTPIKMEEKIGDIELYGRSKKASIKNPNIAFT